MIGKDLEQWKIQLRHYYSFVTLQTVASHRSLTKNDLIDPGLFNTLAFAHETSAALGGPEDPVLWSSYSKREFSADSHLLSLLKEQDPDSVPGFSTTHKTHGDGGPTTDYSKFKVSLQPWDASSDQEQAMGVVEIEVVAAGTGHGDIISKRGGESSKITRVFNEWMHPTSEAKAVDLNDPPKGYETSVVSAELLSRTGVLSSHDCNPIYAQRDVAPATDPLEPTITAENSPTAPSVGNGSTLASVLQEHNIYAERCFELSATLRAGAFMDKDGFRQRRTVSLVPINAYAQFVLKITVALLPGRQLVAAPEPLSPKKMRSVSVSKEGIRENRAHLLPGGPAACLTPSWTRW